MIVTLSEAKSLVLKCEMLRTVQRDMQMETLYA